MAKSKLRTALDAHKGVDHQKLKETKRRKEGEKKAKARRSEKAKNKPKENGHAEADEDEDAGLSGDESDEGGVLIDETAVGKEISKAEEKKLQAELKALLADKKKLMAIDSGSELESSEAEAEEAEVEEDDDQEETARAKLSRLADSESESDSDDEEEKEEEEDNSTDEELHNALIANGAAFEASASEDADSGNEEAEEDIPLSDLDSLASDDKGDIIPHQRLTINNHAALRKAYTRIALPISSLPFSLHQSLTTPTNTANAIPDIDDDLARELALYAQSLSAVKAARELLEKEGVPFRRPTDYFAEMVKSDEHMGRVKERLRDEAARKKASAEARRQRDLKKFGKQVQVAKIQERAKEKRETLDRINTLKRKRAGAMPTAENEPDLFDVSLEDTATTAKKDRDARRAAHSSSAKGDRNRSEPNPKRQKKDAKFGFGGKKRFAKSTDAESTADTRGYSAKKMKKPFSAGGGGKGGGKPRLGKSKRAKARA